jgi:hypothetical protein
VGKPPRFSRKKVDAGICKLKKIAKKALAYELAESEFTAHADPRKNYHIKGRSPDDKKAKFEKWLKARFGKTNGLIYEFWGNHTKCIYVGRTGFRGSRPSSHVDKGWFSGVKRATIYPVRVRSHIPKLECLAIDRFQPTRNKNKPGIPKWAKACPLHKKLKYIETELRRIFRFK